MKQPATYILASGINGTLYVGVTSNLIQRIWQHRSGVMSGFAAKYHCHHLVHFELCSDMTNAIMREKQIKSWSRSRKITLFVAANPRWRDLYDDLL